MIPKSRLLKCKKLSSGQEEEEPQTPSHDVIGPDLEANRSFFTAAILETERSENADVRFLCVVQQEEITPTWPPL
ncbi:hypothetical protein EYF80_035272 [Liparis tanakae]|uniref:Uncharacterized protein n=1 Tax=Liparis tanakae TaxID=230148 RepID=A0A4Z2GLS4_9TELE|nr:hypothetical protein EYF80_035272 [Liparis tanakae]